MFMCHLSSLLTFEMRVSMAIIPVPQFYTRFGREGGRGREIIFLVHRFFRLRGVIPDDLDLNTV